MYDLPKIRAFLYCREKKGTAQTCRNTAKSIELYLKWLKYEPSILIDPILRAKIKSARG